MHFIYVETQEALHNEVLYLYGYAHRIGNQGAFQRRVIIRWLNPDGLIVPVSVITDMLI